MIVEEKIMNEKVVLVDGVETVDWNAVEEDLKNDSFLLETIDNADVYDEDVRVGVYKLVAEYVVTKKPTATKIFPKK
jgi:hypothetical protein